MRRSRIGHHLARPFVIAGTILLPAVPIAPRHVAHHAGRQPLSHRCLVVRTLGVAHRLMRLAQSRDVHGTSERRFACDFSLPGTAGAIPDHSGRNLATPNIGAFATTDQPFSTIQRVAFDCMALT